MRLVILDDYDQVSLWAAKYIRRRIKDFNPGPDKYFTLGLPTGTHNLLSICPANKVFGSRETTLSLCPHVLYVHLPLNHRVNIDEICMKLSRYK